MRRPHPRPTTASGTRLRPLRRLPVALAALVLAAAGVAACSDKEEGPKPTVEAFLRGWAAGRLDDVGFIAPSGAAVAAGDVVTQIKALSGKLADRPPVVRLDGDPEVTENLATAKLTVDWTLPASQRHWTYPTSVRLSKAEKRWRVIWTPAVLHPQLAEGDAFDLRRVAPTRAPILDAAGAPIVRPRAVVVVGIERARVTDLTTLVNQLNSAFTTIRADIGPLPLTGLADRVTAAAPNAFVEVVTLRREVYEKIRYIRDLNGTVFREEDWDLPPSRTFARALLGSVDPVLKEDMDRNPGKYLIGDKVGHGGVQQRHDDRLRGLPGEAVVIVRKAPDGSVSNTEVFRIDATAGQPVKLTLDQRLQVAADRAVAAQPRPSALVAVRVSDGAVLAAANGPTGGGPNLAFTAQVPPGSTFKMVSTLGLLDARAVTLNGIVACPKTITVAGRSFKNAGNLALGRVSFRTDFARSCNTAFASLAPKLGDNGLAEAGTRLGLGGTWDLGADVFTGKVSVGGGAAERAAATFGQGTTVVSPLAMAAATAAVARGQWQQPQLVLDPAPATPAAPGPALTKTTVDALRIMMREVVTKGTGTALGDVPGSPVFAKTGTAEFNNNPADTHAWVIGWQGDIAFAVFVDKGGSGSRVAIPIAESFLRAARG